MYRLIPWKNRIIASLTVVVMVAVYANEFEVYTGIGLSDHALVRYLPIILICILTITFAPYGRWAPWRLIWKICPLFNHIFPDINGVWYGSTSSNWPTIKAMFDASQTDCALSQEELNSISLQTDALAIEIKATLFKIQITACLSSTKGKSYSIIVCPRKDIHNRLILTYVYNQDTPKPSATDADNHLGAVDLIIDMDNLNQASGVYWTRRNWKQGFNTAGLLELRRIDRWRDKGKALSDYLTDN